MFKILVKIPEGWRGYFCGQKMEIPGWRGVLREIPSVVGVWIFSGTTHSEPMSTRAVIQHFSRLSLASQKVLRDLPVHEDQATVESALTPRTTADLPST